MARLGITGVPPVTRRFARVIVSAGLLVGLCIVCIVGWSSPQPPPVQDLKTRSPSRDVKDFSEEFRAGSKFPPVLRGKDARGTPSASEVNWYLDRRLAGREEFDWPTMDKMFVFGDSFCNLNKNYRKDGVDGGFTPRLHDKSTDMKWTDFLYSRYKDFHKQQYWNFARDGAVIDGNVVAPRQESYGTFNTQIDDFRDLFTPMPGQRNVNWHSNDTLFIASLGVNDMGSIARLEWDPDEVTEGAQRLAAGMMAGANRLYELGARSFLFVNVPPLECAPKFRLRSEPGHHGRSTIYEAVREYNANLERAVSEFEKQFPSVNAMLFDWFAYYELIYAHPEAFGLTELGRYNMVIKDRLMNHGRMGFFYHDNGHPSWTVADLLARAVHGFLLRHSSSFWVSNATENALHV